MGSCLSLLCNNNLFLALALQRLHRNDLEKQNDPNGLYYLAGRICWLTLRMRTVLVILQRNQLGLHMPRSQCLGPCLLPCGQTLSSTYSRCRLNLQTLPGSTSFKDLVFSSQLPLENWHPRALYMLPICLLQQKTAGAEQGKMDLGHFAIARSSYKWLDDKSLYDCLQYVVDAIELSWWYLQDSRGPGHVSCRAVAYKASRSSRW